MLPVGGVRQAGVPGADRGQGVEGQASAQFLESGHRCKVVTKTEARPAASAHFYRFDFMRHLKTLRRARPVKEYILILFIANGPTLDDTFLSQHDAKYPQRILIKNAFNLLLVIV